MVCLPWGLLHWAQVIVRFQVVIVQKPQDTEIIQSLKNVNAKHVKERIPPVSIRQTGLEQMALPQREVQLEEKTPSWGADTGEAAQGISIQSPGQGFVSFKLGQPSPSERQGFPEAHEQP